MEVCYFGISAYPSAPRKVFDYHNVKFIIQIIVITNFLGTFVKHAQIVISSQVMKTSLHKNLFVQIWFVCINIYLLSSSYLFFISPWSPLETILMSFHK